MNRPFDHIAGALPHDSPRLPEGANAPQSLNLSTCPDCDGPLSHRIVNEDTGCSYPVDDGEHYCLNCDALFTDEYLAETGWALAERCAIGMAR